MANYFIEEMKRFGVGDISLHHREKLNGISFGVVALNSSKILLDNFFRSNDDNRILMAELSFQDHQVAIYSHDKLSLSSFTKLNISELRPMYNI